MGGVKAHVENTNSVLAQSSELALDLHFTGWMQTSTSPLFVSGTNGTAAITRGPACTLYSCIPVSCLGLWGDVTTSVQMGAEECDVTNFPGPPNKLKSRLLAQKGYPPK